MHLHTHTHTYTVHTSAGVHLNTERSIRLFNLSSPSREKAGFFFSFWLPHHVSTLSRILSSFPPSSPAPLWDQIKGSGLIRCGLGSGCVSMQATGPSVEALPTVRRRKKRLWIWIYFLFRPSYHFALFSLFLCLLSISVIPFSPFYPFSLFHSSFYCLDPRWFCHHLKVGPTGCQRCRPQSFKKWLIVYSNICNFKPLTLVFFGKRHLITTMMPFNESGNYSRERFWSAKKIRFDAVEEMSSRLKTTDWCGRWDTSGLIWSQRHALSNEPSD